MSNQIIELTASNFDQTIQSGKVLVDFWASWCGPCRMQMPVIETLASESSDVVFAKVNADEERDIVFKYQVMSIPTLLLFENGELKKTLVGYHNETLLRQELS